MADTAATDKAARDQEVAEAYEKQRASLRSAAESGRMAKERADEMIAFLNLKEDNQRKAEGLPPRRKSA
ncbi:MAG: hypothetical protein HY330_02295 [Chloroflexi bacterium]|nr:hypothetical protein [Chloroflexota bacterium]